ncbi:glycosyltransferase family 2 protein [Tatumella punctata]|uniref:Glycosyltransferase family 2 protein n=1 Tax=Tatumella punctata TaxID=399969 RepID=A0ABW1VQ58_9GAMM
MRNEIIIERKIKIDVVLATYNGAQFIKEQIKSIESQSLPVSNIIISDDNSTDNTFEIIKELSKKNKIITYHKNSNGKGVISNFNNALKYSTGDYILFCDQDDVWDTNKVYTLIKKVQSIDTNGTIPALVFSDMRLIDSETKCICESFYSYNGLNPKNNQDIRFLMWRSTLYGCTMLINKKLLSISGETPIDFNMHDHWYAINASKHGVITFCEEKLVAYRQHDNNVVGSHNHSLVSRISRAKKTLKSINKASQVAYDLYKNEANIDRLNLNVKIDYIRCFVVPFLNEKIIYSLLFIVFFLVK